MTISLPTTVRSAPCIHRRHQPGLRASIVQLPGLRELHITLRPQHGERSSMLLWRLDALLRYNHAAVVRHEVFGSLAAHDDFLASMTMQVVRAILVSREMDYPDVTRATAYLRNPADAPLFHKWPAKLGLEKWPLVTTQAVICRDELLFEIEVDAMAPLLADAVSSSMNFLKPEPRGG